MDNRLEMDESMNFEIIKNEINSPDNRFPEEGNVVVTVDLLHQLTNKYLITNDGMGYIGLVDLSNGMLMFNESESYNDYHDLINKIMEHDDAHEYFLVKHNQLNLIMDLNKPEVFTV